MKKNKGSRFRALTEMEISLELKLVIKLRIWFLRNLENFDFLQSLEMKITFGLMMVFL